jgi:hypothetical protein
LTVNNWLIACDKDFTSTAASVPFQEGSRNVSSSNENFVFKFMKKINKTIKKIIVQY